MCMELVSKEFDHSNLWRLSMKWRVWLMAETTTQIWQEIPWCHVEIHRNSYPPWNGICTNTCACHFIWANQICFMSQQRRWREAESSFRIRAYVFDGRQPTHLPEYLLNFAFPATEIEDAGPTILLCEGVGTCTHLILGKTGFNKNMGATRWCATHAQIQSSLWILEILRRRSTCIA